MSTNHQHTDEQLADEAMEQLAAANPAQPGAVDGRARALYSRITAGSSSSSPGGIMTRWKFATGGVAAVALAAVMSFAVVASGGNDNGNNDNPLPADQSSDEPIGGGGGIAGSCIGYSEEELQLRDFAFHGTATNLTDTTVTFDVVEWYAGDRGDSVTLELDFTLQDSLYRDVTFAEGEDYLVSGDEEFAWGCGFTRAYDPDLAASWAALLK